MCDTYHTCFIPSVTLVKEQERTFAQRNFKARSKSEKETCTVWHMNNGKIVRCKHRKKGTEEYNLTRTLLEVQFLIQKDSRSRSTWANPVNLGWDTLRNVAMSRRPARQAKQWSSNRTWQTHEQQSVQLDTSCKTIITATRSKRWAARQEIAQLDCCDIMIRWVIECKGMAGMQK